MKGQEAPDGIAAALAPGDFGMIWWLVQSTSFAIDV
jgi:hypothetical protein